ncbi:MAG: TlpA family protein disulfide reductase [Deltaproteobacteria bacterium]|nr:TlpA family protein disulfide reductase [Deltaproteobacteria bacterium]
MQTYPSRAAYLLVALASCGGGGGGSGEPTPGSASATPPPPPRVARPAPIQARTGPVELAADDGVPAGGLSIAEYDARYRPLQGLVPATVWPDGLTPAARAGINLVVGGKNVTWVADRDAAGAWLAYDADADGDLREEPKLRFARDELVVPVPGDVKRFRRRGDAMFVQTRTIRRGAIAVGGKRLAFALLGDGGRFGEPHQALAIDLDGDGALDLDAVDGPELVHMFEKAVRIGDTGFTLHVDGDGAVLELVPLDRPPPFRPPLVENTLAPPFEATARDGSHVALDHLQGSVVVLDFWARGCKPCLDAFPKLRRLPEGVQVVGVAATDDGDATGLDLPGTQILDRADEIQSRYRVARWPTYFLIDRTGKIACARCALDDIVRLIPKL